MSTQTDTATIPLLAGFADRFAADEGISTDELLMELEGRFSFVCEAVTTDHLTPSVLADDLRFLEHFLGCARHELMRTRGWSL